MLRDRNAFVYLRGDSMLIGTISGPGACVQNDWHQPVCQAMLSEMTDGKIGEAIRLAWSRFREIPLHDSKEIQAIRMQTIGLGKVTLKKLYAGTKTVSAYMKNGTINIWATIQDRVGGFSPLPGVEVSLPEDSTNEAIGEAVRDMLHKSQTKF